LASRNKDERAHVNALIKAIQKNSSGVYVYIDRDAGSMRHTSSGWDFLLAHNNKVVFCEAKEGYKKLSDWQECIQALVRSAECSYHVIRFWNNGMHYTVDDDDNVYTTADITFSAIPANDK
jgi:hypothetical protein